VFVSFVLTFNRSSGVGNMHGFLQVGHHDMSSRTDQSMTMNPSPNNLDLALQGHHQQQQQQLLSSLGAPELLLSPNSPYGFQSSLLRSLMEPTAKPAAAGIQQYQYQQMGQTAAVREPLQFTNDAAFWNASSAGFGMAPPAADQGGARATVKQSPAPRGANLALKVCAG
jgi:hypothetical protein